MGYPMRAGYRAGGSPGLSSGLSTATGRAGAAPSNVPGQLNLEQLTRAIESATGISRDLLPKLPANDIAKLPLRRWFRFLPWLRPWMTVLDLFDLYRSAFDSSGYSQNCTRANNSCNYSVSGTVAIPGTPTCAGTWFPSGVFPGMSPGGVVEVGQWDGQGPLGCGVLKGTSFQNKGWVKTTAGAVPFRYYMFPRLNPQPNPVPRPDEIPWGDPWANPIQQPGPQTLPMPWEAIPYRPNPWSDPSTVPAPGPRSPPTPQPRPDPDPRTRPRPKPEPDPLHPPPPKPKPPVDPDPVPRTPSGPAYSRGGFKLEPYITVRQSDSPVHRPPGKRTTEAKLNSKLGSFVWYFAHVATESKDVLEGLWKALPDGLKTKQKKAKGLGKHGDRRTPPIPKMFKDVTSGIRQINQYDENHPWANETDRYWSRAVDEIAQNLFQDYVFGKLGSAVARQSAKSGRPIGFAAGPAL